MHRRYDTHKQGRKLTDQDKEIIKHILMDNRSLTGLNGICFDGNTRLDLHGRVLELYEIQFLANRLKGHLTLTELNLSNSGLRGKTAELVVQALFTNNSLTHVDFSQNKLGDRGVISVVRLLASPWAFHSGLAVSAPRSVVALELPHSFGLLRDSCVVPTGSLAANRGCHDGSRGSHDGVWSRGTEGLW